MKTVKIYKAQESPMGSAESLRIELDEELPEIESLEVLRHAFKEQAKELCEALFNSLPGGTLDALLIELLEKKHSSLVVKAPE